MPRTYSHKTWQSWAAERVGRAMPAVGMSRYGQLWLLESISYDKTLVQSEKNVWVVVFKLVQGQISRVPLPKYLWPAEESTEEAL